MQLSGALSLPGSLLQLTDLQIQPPQPPLLLISVSSNNKTIEFCLDSPFVSCHPESTESQGYRKKDPKLLFIFFTFSHGSQSCTAFCPKSQDSYLIYFCSVFYCYGRRASPISVTSSYLEEKVQRSVLIAVMLQEK